MQLTLRDDLVFASVVITYRGAAIEVPDVLLDTGSATTVLAARAVAPIGIVPELDDTLYTIRDSGNGLPGPCRRYPQLARYEHRLRVLEAIPRFWERRRTAL